MKFYVCHQPITVKSSKSWWPNYKVLWGHKHISKCGYNILVSKVDYNNLQIFASNNPVGGNQTYQMEIIRLKSFFGDYWTLSNFVVHNGRCCLP